MRKEQPPVGKEQGPLHPLGFLLHLPLGRAGSGEIGKHSEGLDMNESGQISPLRTANPGTAQRSGRGSWGEVQTRVSCVPERSKRGQQETRTALSRGLGTRPGGRGIVTGSARGTVHKWAGTGSWVLLSLRRERVLVPASCPPPLVICQGEQPREGELGARERCPS